MVPDRRLGRFHSAHIGAHVRPRGPPAAGSKPRSFPRRLTDGCGAIVRRGGGNLSADLYFGFFVRSLFLGGSGGLALSLL